MEAEYPAVRQAESISVSASAHRASTLWPQPTDWSSTEKSAGMAFQGFTSSRFQSRSPVSTFLEMGLPASFQRYVTMARRVQGRLAPSSVPVTRPFS